MSGSDYNHVAAQDRRQLDQSRRLPGKMYVSVHPMSQLPDDIYEVLSSEGGGLNKTYKVRNARTEEVSTVLAAHTFEKPKMVRTHARKR